MFPSCGFARCLVQKSTLLMFLFALATRKENIRFKDNDGIDLFPKFNYDNKIVVCTACEHIDNEELDFMIRQKKPKLLMCLQSNNYYEVDSHINCSDTLEDFIASLPLKKILYAGKKNYKNKYDRFMVIGK